MKKWIKAAGIRAIKTFAQAAVAAIPAEIITIGAVDWLTVFSTAILAAVLSILTSIAGIPEADNGVSVPKLLDK